MAPEQKIGSIGTVNETYAKGVVTADVEIALPATSYGLGLSVSIKGGLDAKILIDYLAVKVGGPVPLEVAKFLELALSAT